MKIKNSLLLVIAGIAFIMFCVWQLSIYYGAIQVIGAGIAIVLAAVMIKFLPKGVGGGEDDFIRAREYAENFVRNRTGSDITYEESMGARKIFTDLDGKPVKFFAFGIKRMGGMRNLLYLVVISKKKYEGFELADEREYPSQNLLDDFFEPNATWSLVMGHPKLAKLHGAPVAIREELFGKEHAPGQQINVGYPAKSEDAEEKEKIGMKK